MRSRLYHLLCLLTLCLFVVAWTAEDHEIFRLKDEVEAAEGLDVSFYDFLGIKSSATVEEIGKAFRKKSRALHPDKVKHSFIAARSTGKPKRPGDKKKTGVHVSKGPSEKEVQKFVKEATERYGRLGVVANVLKGPQRERYDHFLSHGFPKWRGTGYYYSRYRPGLGTVLVGLFLVCGGGAHYLALITSYRRQREFMERYIKHARKMAWGDESGIRGIPGISGPTQVDTPTAEEADPMANLNRRQKRELERQNKKEKSKGRGKTSGTSTPVPQAQTVSSPTGEKRRVTAENGKVLIVDSVGNVFLEEEDEDGNVNEYLLDLDEIQKPTIRDTAVFKFPIWLYRKAADPFLKGTAPMPSDEVPLTESEKRSEPEDDSSIPVPDVMSASQLSENGFEIVDSIGIEEAINAGAGGMKRRSKNKKK